MKRILAILTVVAAAGGAAFWFHPRNVVKAGTLPAITAQSATDGVIVAAGRVEPFSEEVKLCAELDGKLKTVFVDEGSTVQRGQLIAMLNDDAYAARVEVAKAAVAEKEAEVDRLKNGSRPMERESARAALREAEALRDHAALERERRRGILDQGAISQAEFDGADREWKVATAKLDAARHHFALVDAEPRADDIRRVEADRDQAKARVHEAQAELDKAIIRSPINGVVLHRYLQSGESVTRNGSPIVSLGDTSKLRVRVDVDETDVAKLRVGQSAYVKAGAYGEERFAGSVSRIGQALGRKRIRTDEPTERVDTKILETLIDLDPVVRLPLGLRVDVFIH